MADDKKPSIFQKALEAGSAMLDAQIAKSRNAVAEQSKTEKQPDSEADFNFGKAVTKDRSYYMGSQGWQEKAGNLSFEYQKQMAVKSSIIAAIIKTRQNRVASYSEYVPEGNKPGFKIVLKHEKDMLEEVKAELFGEEEETKQAPGGTDSIEGQLSEAAAEVKKSTIGLEDLSALASSEEAPQEQLTEEEKNRQAKEELEKRTKKKKQSIADFVLHCGELKDRPFESKKWSFDSFLRAFVWDTLVYDQVAVELVPKDASELKGRLNIHHFQPVDGATVRYASQELAKYKTADMALTADILYPEEELKALEERDALELDDTRLENNEYKYVQVIRGRIQRAFTQDELRVGMRNPTTDIYTNGYSISELELLVALVTSHLQTEFYNRAYFQQGFSAKGILHVKANLNRSKLEELRRQWNHMVKGNKNSFQTPIMAGMDEVQWIPLTQSHSEMEFTMWLNYLIRMICAIYQIDPSEIGYGIKDEGGGGGLSGDNTKEKLKNSKDKGFVPLMKFVQDFINKNIIEEMDPDYKLEWVGLQEESDAERVERQEREGKFKKSLNEIRAEDGLPPIKGADHLILDPVYFQWFSQFSEEGQEMIKQMQEQQQMNAPAEEAPVDPKQQWQADEASKENDHMRGIESKLLDTQLDKQSQKPDMQKSVKIEYYRL